LNFDNAKLCFVFSLFLQPFLDQIEGKFFYDILFLFFYLRLDFSGIQWGNNCNELNASYAADGYARILGIGVRDNI
jgi:hypothetical protein